MRPELAPLLFCALLTQEPAGPLYPEMPPSPPPAAAVPEAEAGGPEAMRPYTEQLAGTEIGFAMAPIPGGRFLMGSPPGEWERRSDEGPAHEVEIAPFWMGVHEVGWDEYQVFMLKLDRELRRAGRAEPAPQDPWADAVSRPTPPYLAMDFEMGVSGFPAICMTQLAARQYTKWLSMKTGRFYRLPTEAEWEYACRAGTTTAFSFGDDPQQLGDYAWYYDNSGGAYHEVGLKKPNPWGLHDMHGNVAEWVLDRHDKKFYATLAGAVSAGPVAWPDKEFPRVVRGGSWDDEARKCRSAARRGSRSNWKMQDPQLPKSIWYHTDASFVGFRVVRPLEEPPAEERARYWEPDLDWVRVILERQRQGGR